MHCQNRTILCAARSSHLWLCMSPTMPLQLAAHCLQLWAHHLQLWCLTGSSWARRTLLQVGPPELVPKGADPKGALPFALLPKGKAPKGALPIALLPKGEAPKAVLFINLPTRKQHSKQGQTAVSERQTKNCLCCQHQQIHTMVGGQQFWHIFLVEIYDLVEYKICYGVKSACLLAKTNLSADTLVDHLSITHKISCCHHHVVQVFRAVPPCRNSWPALCHSQNA